MTKEERKTQREGAPMPADGLARKMGRFGLTMAVARRASSLMERYGRNGGREGAVERALADIASGRAKIVKEAPAVEPVAAAEEPKKERKRAKRAA